MCYTSRATGKKMKFYHIFGVWKKEEKNINY